MADITTDDNPHTETTTTTNTQKPQPYQPQDSQVPWYIPTLTTIPAPMSSLLQTYSSIPPSTQIPHVLAARDRAYTLTPYPCLGRFRFLNLDLSAHPIYTSSLLPLLTRPSTTFTPAHDPLFLDIGSCLGQDLRKLVADGVPVSRIYGSDLRWETIEAGYDLFRDEDRFPRDRFLVPGNVLDGTSGRSALGAMRGKCDVVNAIAVFHLFDRPEQMVMAKELPRLLRRDGGSGERKLLMGQQLGAWEAGIRESSRGKRFRHNETTWKEMWDEVLGAEEWEGVVAKWEVDSQMQVVDRWGRVENEYVWHLWWVWVEFQ